MVCLLLEQRTQLEALVLGGRVTAQTEKHPHTLCGMCNVSSDRKQSLFFEEIKFNKGVKHFNVKHLYNTVYVKNVDEMKYFTM